MKNSLSSLIEKVFQSYLQNKTLPLKGNEFANSVRANGPKIIQSVLNNSNLKVQCSVGQGNWAEVPWFGIFNPEVSTSATKGIYVVYLFSSDMTKVYLCQGQGVTAVKEDFGRAQYEELSRRSSLIRSRVPEYKKNFDAKTISLNAKTSLAKEYEPAVAYSKVYRVGKLPNETVLQNDLLEAIRCYDYLVSRGGTDNLETAIDLLHESSANQKQLNIVETKKYVRQIKIERNSKASKEAKKILGTKCEGCGIKFEDVYGFRAKGFIEAHHKIPLSHLEEGESVSMDPKTDFAVLCSNCHRVVHMGETLLSVEDLRDIPQVQELRKFYENINRKKTIA